MTLYQVLGVQRTATGAQLKKAWRDLARQNHPDLHPDDAGASDRLAAINAAYTVLSDPERRAQYDAYGEDGASAFFDPGSATAPQPRTPSTPRAVEAGEDLEVEVQLDSLVAARGGQVVVTVRAAKLCTVCQGTGWRRAGRACSKCEGGRLPGIGPYRMGVPAGVVSGQVLRAVGFGAAGRGKGASRGDLLVTVRVPPQFVVEGADLVTDVPCPRALLDLGGTVRIATPQGESVTVRVRPSTQVGQRMRLRGKGGAGRDLLVRMVLLPEASIDVPVGTVSAR